MEVGGGGGRGGVLLALISFSGKRPRSKDCVIAIGI